MEKRRSLVLPREQFHTRRRAEKYCLYICYAYIPSMYCYFIIRIDFST